MEEYRRRIVPPCSADAGLFLFHGLSAVYLCVQGVQLVGSIQGYLF